MGRAPTYGARIRFLLDPTERLGSDAESWEITLDGVSWRLEPFGNSQEGNDNLKKISETNHLVFVARGFPSEDLAREHGFRVKAAVSLCGAVMHIGIDVGRDSSDFVPTDYWKEQVRRNTGQELHNDLHGLTVYPEEPPAVFVHGSISPTVARCFDRFTRSFLGAHSDKPLTPKLELGLELYARSHFETSVRTRFLSLINAVEAIAVQQGRSKKVRDLVDNLIEAVRTARIDSSDQASILGSMARLKHESIGQACRRVVRANLANASYGQKGAVEFFRQCYDVRSDLLHEGDVANSLQVLRSLVGELDKLVSDLLVAEAGVSLETDALQ